MPDERLIYRDFLSHLCFPDDILIWDNIPNELQQMPHELAEERGCQGMKMNKLKTKGKQHNVIIVYANTIHKQNVERYTSTCNSEIAPETKIKTRRFKKVSRPAGEHSPSTFIFKGNTETCLKRQVYHWCVFLAMTYDAETWAIIKQANNKLAAAQRWKTYV